MDLAVLVEDMGGEPVGPATSLDAALSLARQEALDFAFLDMNIRGVKSLPIASVLKERAIPFVFLTGYGAPNLGEEFSDVEVVTKPLSTHKLHMILAELTR